MLMKFFCVLHGYKSVESYGVVNIAEKYFPFTVASPDVDGREVAGDALFTSDSDDCKARRRRSARMRQKYSSALDASKESSLTFVRRVFSFEGIDSNCFILKGGGDGLDISSCFALLAFSSSFSLCRFSFL